MTPFKIGLMSTSQMSFPGDKEGVYRRSVEGMSRLAKRLGFELFAYPGTVITPEDCHQAIAKMEEEQVDFLLVQHTSYSAGLLANVYSRIKNARLGLWAIPEYQEDGAVPFNSFCSINMHQSIIRHYLKDFNIKSKWFFGDVEDPQFVRRLELTVTALTTIKKMRSSKIALIGGIAPGFNDLYNDERQYNKLFDGLYYNRLHEYEELKARALSYDDALVAKTAEKMDPTAKEWHKKASPLKTISARMYLAYTDFVKAHGYDALAISCWPKFQDDFQYSVCSVVAQLNDDGIPTAWEGDPLSAISMLVLSFLTGEPSMLMDLSAFDEQDDTVLMWHCGPASARYAKQNGYSMGLNYSGAPHEDPRNPSGLGITRNMVFDRMDATIFRLTGECDKIFLMEGTFIGDTKKSFHGSRGWYGNLRLNGTPISAKDVANTVLVTGFQHHFPMVAGRLTDVSKEFAAWLGLGFVERVPYADYLQV